MRLLSFAATFAAIGLCALSQSARADGPVRSAIRGTGEVVAEGAGAVARGTEAAVGGAARATGTVFQGAAEGTRGIGAGINAITPGLPLQAQAGYRFQAGEEARDARWRFAQHNGEWWYYGPENAWMYHRDGRWNAFSQDNFTPNPGLAGQAYGAGYRGEQGDQAAPSAQGADAGMAQAQVQGPVYRLQHDQNGREFICDNGHRVYFDNGQAEAGGQQQWQSGYQPTPTPAIPQDQGAMAQPGTSAQPGAATQPGATGQIGAGASTQPGASLQGGASATTQPGASVQGGASATAPGASVQGGASATTPSAPATGAVSGAIQGSATR